MRTLQVATIRVDGHRRGRELRPQALAHVAKERRRLVGRGAIHGRELHHAGEACRAEQVRQDAQLRGAHAIERAGRLDTAQDLGVEQERRRGERLLVEEGDGLGLARPGNRREALATLAAVLLLRVEPADHRHDVIQLGGPLPDGAAVELGEVAPVLARLRRGRQQHARHAFQVLESQASRDHGVGVAHGLGLLAGIAAAAAGGREAQPRRGVLRAGPLVERLLLGIRRRGTRNRRVAPPGREHVVGTDAGDQQRRVDLVLGLRHVVEARVVHQRRRVAHRLQPLGIAELLDRIQRARLHVVLEAERVADLVRDDVLHEFPHQIVGHRQRLRAGIERPGLREVPRPLEVHDVVVHLDVRLEDLARARVADVRPRGVLDRRRQPSHHRVPRVLRLPVRVVGRRVLRDDGVAEARRLEGRLPLLDALLHVRHQLGRRRRIDVVDDRLDRLGHGGRGILLLEAPARDVAALRGAMFIDAVVHLPHREVADPIVVEAWLHRRLRQAHHAEVHQHAVAARAEWRRLERVGRPRRAAAGR